MKSLDLNIIFRLFDFILWPFMFLLGGFTFPVQETHKWHTKNWNWKKNKGLSVTETDKLAKFGHDSPFGLFHMPIFGGLRRYVVVEALGFNRYWHVGHGDNIHRLKIRQNRIMMLVGKGGFVVRGLGDNNKNLKLKIVGYGNLGDNKYKNIRLF